MALLLALFFFVLFSAATGFGQSGQAPAVVDQALLQALLGHQWLVVSSILIGGAVRLVKGDTPLPYVPPRYRPFLAVLLGGVSAALQALTQHIPVQQALLEGALSVFVAISGHEIIIESLFGGRELGGPKRDASSSPPPKATP
jgi:hypothetical protein